MSNIQSATQSPLFNQQDTKTHKPHNQTSETPKQQQNSSSNSSDNFRQSEFDILDLTPATKNLLQQIEERFFQTLSSYPEYQTHFSSEKIVNPQLSQEKQALHYISMCKKFLDNPYIIRLSEQDPTFCKFYEKIKDLNESNEKALLSRHEQELKQEAPTYHKLFKK